MTLATVVKGPEGVVLAAESRLTLEIEVGDKFRDVAYDHATKVLGFSAPQTNVGAVTFGQGALDGDRTAASYLPEFEDSLSDERLSVRAFANALNEFFRERYTDARQAPAASTAPMSFLVAGYDADSPYAQVFELNVPETVTPIEHFASEPRFGILWRGQDRIVRKLFDGFDPVLPDIIQDRLGLEPRQMKELRAAAASLEIPVPWQAIGLQDCVDLAIFGISTTITAQRLSAEPRRCGGAIDVAVITRRDGLSFVQRKELRGDVTLPR